MAQKDLLLPWRRALDNAILGSELGRRGPVRGPGSGVGLVRAVRPRRVRGGVAARAQRRDATAARPPAHLPVPARRAAARRALRRARRDHPAGHGHLARRGVGRRPADRPARDPRRRGGAAAVRPGGGDVGPARHDRGVHPGRPRPAPAGRARDRPRLRRAAGAGAARAAGRAPGAAGPAARWHTEPPWTSPRSSTPTARPRCSSSGSRIWAATRRGSTSSRGPSPARARASNRHGRSTSAVGSGRSPGRSACAWSGRCTSRRRPRSSSGGSWTGGPHAPWVLRAEVAALDAGSPGADRSRLTMHLHYGGGLWGPVLERVLGDEIERSRPRLLRRIHGDRAGG